MENKSLYEIAKLMTADEMCVLISDYMNRYDTKHAGIEVGKHAKKEHRTIQSYMIRFALEFIASISEQNSSDERNEVALATAKKIKKMMDNGELPTVAKIN